MKVKIKGPFPEGMKINRAGKTFVAEADGDAYFTGKKKECEHLCAAYCYEVEAHDEAAETVTVETQELDPSEITPETAEAIADNLAPAVEAALSGAGEAEANAEGTEDETGAKVAETASESSEAIVEPAKKPRRRRAAKKAE